VHFIKSVKLTSHIVSLKDDREEKQIDDGRLFHTLTTRFTILVLLFLFYFLTWLSVLTFYCVLVVFCLLAYIYKYSRLRLFNLGEMSCFNQI